jgi:hypothetical protein
VELEDHLGRILDMEESNLKKLCKEGRFTMKHRYACAVFSGVLTKDIK